MNAHKLASFDIIMVTPKSPSLHTFVVFVRASAVLLTGQNHIIITTSHFLNSYLSITAVTW